MTAEGPTLDSRTRPRILSPEIVASLAAVVLLASVLWTTVLPKRSEALREVTLWRLASVQEALARYRADFGSYPSSEREGLEALLHVPSGAASGRELPYLDARFRIADSWGTDFEYSVSQREDAGEDYRLFSAGPDTVVGTEDDIELAR